MKQLFSHSHTVSPLVLHGSPLLLLSIALLGLWQIDRYVAETEKQLYLKETHILAEQSSYRLEEFFNARFQIVHHLTTDWEFILNGSESAFTAEVLRMQDLFKGFQAINWVDRDGIIQWVTPQAANAAMKGKSILDVKAAAPIFEKTRRTNIAHVTPPVHLLQGNTGIVGYFPVRKNKEFDGVITAVFDTDVLIEAALANSFGPDRSFSITNGDQRVYQNSTRSGDVTLNVSHEFNVWDQKWTLHLESLKPLSDHFGLSRPLALVFIVLALFAAGLLRQYLKRFNDLVIANNAKTEFLANMSHELRTPLNSIIGYAQLMELEVKGPLSPDYKEYTQLITYSGRLLLETITSILDIAKIEAGKFELNKQNASIAALMKDTVALLQLQANEKGLVLHNNVTDVESLFLDPMRVEQVFLNVVGNAIKFTEKGTITIESYCDVDECIVSVTDTGIGMTPEEIEIALKPFQQVHGTSFARRFQGTGLGLSLSSQVMQLHGGRLIIASTPTQGTTVKLHFPRYARPQA